MIILAKAQSLFRGVLGNIIILQRIGAIDNNVIPNIHRLDSNSEL